MRLGLVISMLLLGAHVHAMPIAPLGQQVVAENASIVDAEGMSVPDSLLQVDDPNEFDPYSPEAQDEINQQEDQFPQELDVSGGCQAQDCAVFVHVSLANQTLTYTVDGKTFGPYPVSSGVPGRSTKRWNDHPTNRIFIRYMSTAFPGGNYIDANGRKLGNMPYAMFFYKGFAIHGVPQGEWGALGHVASHGCVRVHPDVAVVLNSYVRHYGPANSWFQIQ